MTLEEWKTIPSEEGYEVSNLGRVRSMARAIVTVLGQVRNYRGKVLRPGRAKSGHMTVACGKGNSRYVHDLVLEAFVGPRPPGMECLHQGDVSHDNRLERLRWGMRSENMTELWANGRRG